MFTSTSPSWFVGQAVRSVQVGGRRSGVPLRLRHADAAREVVALVDRDHEERVALVDPVLLQVLEELLRTRCRSPSAAAGARSRRGRSPSSSTSRSRAPARGGRARRRCSRRSPARRSPASLDVAERVLREHPVEAGEPAVADRVGDRVAARVGHAGVAAGDRRVDVFRAEQRLVARCSRPARRRAGRACALPFAVARRSTWSASSGSRCRRSRSARPAESAFASFHSGEPVRRPSSCRQRRVVRGVLELDVRRADAAEVTAGPGEGYPRRGRRLARR